MSKPVRCSTGAFRGKSAASSCHARREGRLRINELSCTLSRDYRFKQNSVEGRKKEHIRAAIDELNKIENYLIAERT